MTIEELLGDLEGMDHAGRVRAMVALGQRDDSEARAIITELERGEFYERSLALYSCFGSRDADHIARALADPSRLLRGLATRLAALYLDDQRVLAALVGATPSTRLALAHKLCRKGRRGVLDGFLASTGAGGLAEPGVRVLLPLASAPVTEAALERFAASATNEDWRRLARSHPELALTALERQAATAQPHDGSLIKRVNGALPMLVARDPDRALALVASLAPRVAELPRFALASLIERRPGATADLIIAQPAETRAWGSALDSFQRRVSKLTANQVIGLYQINTRVFGWTNAWFGKVAPTERLAVYTALEVRLKHGGKLPKEFVAALPEAERVRQARAIVAPTGVISAHWPRYAAYLPWEEARAALDPNLRASETSRRTEALETLIGTVVYHRERLSEALAELKQRRNEHDSVRRAMFAALRKLAPGVWRVEHLPDLEEIIRHGLNDIGLSGQTHIEIIGLLYRLAPFHPEWACAQLERVMRERGWPVDETVDVIYSANGQRIERNKRGRRVTWGSHSQALPRAIDERLAGAITPVLAAWVTRGDEGATLDAIARLVMRPATLARFADILEALARQTTQRDLAERALGLLASAAPARFAALVAALLAEDDSWYTLPVVAEWVVRRRQDLLTPFLDYRSYHGRWDTGRQRALPAIRRPLAGATRLQQERLLNAVLPLALAPEADSAVAVAAIKLLPLLPAILPGFITPLAKSDNSLARTAALFALARLDTDAGLETLLEALGDERARIAIHCLRRFLVVMDTDRALAILRAVPLDRVTVAKEVMRLTAELAPAVAYDELLAFERRDLHRDTRIALLRALNAYLDRPQTWEILERAAASADEDVAQATLTLWTLANPNALATQQSAETQRNALRLAAALLQRSDAETRKTALHYCASLGLADTERVVTPTLLALVEAGVAPGHTHANHDEALPALKAYVGVCAPDDGTAAADLTTKLLPHRSALSALVEALIAAPRRRERGLRPVGDAVVGAMASDPFTVRLRARITLHTLSVNAIIAFFTALASESALRLDDLEWACGQFGQHYLQYTEAAMLLMETSWRVSTDERLRRLALAVLVRSAQTSGGWTSERLQRLRAYREDRSPLVASAAAFVFPFGDAPEEPPLV